MIFQKKNGVFNYLVNFLNTTKNFDQLFVSKNAVKQLHDNFVERAANAEQT